MNSLKSYGELGIGSWKLCSATLTNMDLAICQESEFLRPLNGVIHCKKIPVA